MVSDSLPPGPELLNLASKSGRRRFRLDDLGRKFLKKRRTSSPPKSGLESISPLRIIRPASSSGSPRHSLDGDSSSRDDFIVIDSQPGSPLPAEPIIALGQDAKTSVWAGLEAALRGLHISAELFPPLQSAVGTLTSCLGVFEVRPWVLQGAEEK